MPIATVLSNSLAGRNATLVLTAAGEPLPRQVVMRVSSFILPLVLRGSHPRRMVGKGFVQPARPPRNCGCGKPAAV